MPKQNSYFIPGLLITVAFAVQGPMAFSSYNEGPSRTSSVSGTFMKPAHKPFSDADVKKIKLPPGFKATVVAKGMNHTRTLLLGTDVIYASDPDAGEVFTLSESADGSLGNKKILVSGIPKANGLALHDGKLYFVAVEKIYELDIAKSDAKSPAKPKVIVDHLPAGGQHSNRVLHAGPDGYMYVSLGSTCNACHPSEAESATMLRMKFDGSDRSTFASGLRDTMAFDWQPGTHNLYGVDNGVDWRGDEIPPEKLNLIRKGGNYGWPFCWGEKKPDPNLIDEPKGSNKAEFCKTTEAPKLMFPAHSAPIDLKFYTGNQFPDEFKHVAFVSMHGSWDRKNPSGYNVYKITFAENGAPRSEEFMSGFLDKGGNGAFGRPAGLLVDQDGSLLVTDDEDGVIYRVSYQAKK